MTAPSIKEALERSIVVIDDWLNVYASELCNQDRVDEANHRISNAGGTLAYIANVQQQNRAALATLPPSGERREAIARALSEKWPGDYMQGDDECEREPNALAYETADSAILASVQDEAAIRADERERIAKSVECDCCDVCGESPGFPKCANEIAAAIRSARDGGAET